MALQAGNTRNCSPSITSIRDQQAWPLVQVTTYYITWRYILSNWFYSFNTHHKENKLKSPIRPYHEDSCHQFTKNCTEYTMIKPRWENLINSKNWWENLENQTSGKDEIQRGIPAKDGEERRSMKRVLAGVVATRG